MTLPDDKDRQQGDRGGEYADTAKTAPPASEPDGARKGKEERLPHNAQEARTFHRGVGVLSGDSAGADAPATTPPLGGAPD